MRNVLGVGRNRAPGKGCVNQMKTAVCALESGVRNRVAGGPGWRSFHLRTALELPLGVAGPCAEEASGTSRNGKVVLGKASTQAKAV